MVLNPVRVKHRELDPKTRAHSYDEAILGFTKEAAMEEASRCINCRTKPCQYACPALTRAPIWTCNALSWPDTWVPTST